MKLNCPVKVYSSVLCMPLGKYTPHTTVRGWVLSLSPSALYWDSSAVGISTVAWSPLARHPREWRAERIVKNCKEGAKGVPNEQVSFWMEHPFPFHPFKARPSRAPLNSFHATQADAPHSWGKKIQKRSPPRLSIDYTSY